MPEPPRILAVVGATATGKTEVGERLAARLDGEVVCADSRQVFRELEIGTGKPTPDQRRALPHHLFDALSLETPELRASAGWYARVAREACAAIHARGRLPILVGGSGLYLRAARDGLAATPPSSPEIRERLRVELEAAGSEALHRRLEQVDPATAARLEPRDGQRISRALEVWEASGRALSWWHAQPREAETSGTWRAVLLAAPPSVLRSRIEERTRRMFSEGLLDETEALLRRGLGSTLARLRAVGYDEAMALAEGRLTREHAEARTSLRTAQLAKRQRTWFRHQLGGEVRLLDCPASAAAIDGLARELETRGRGV